MKIQPISHNPFIDWMRGMSILCVILTHLSIHLPSSIQNSIQNILPKALYNIIFKSGFYGVIIFFVISGYLITQSSFKHFGSLENISLKHFYRLRFARIAPCLILLLLVLGILNYFEIPHFNLAEKHTSYSQALLSALSFQINVLQAKLNYLPATFDVLWSLSIEECFYVFFPLLCLFESRKVFFGFLISLILIAPFFRVFSHNEIWADHGYFSCFDSIAIGIFAYFVSQKKSFIQQNRLWILSLSLATFILVFFFRKFSFDIGISKWGLNNTLLSLSIAGLFMISSQSLRNRFINPINLLVRSFGKTSYEIYLSHSFVVIGFKSIFEFDSILNWMPIHLFSTLFIYFIAIFLCYVLGIFIARYFSIPMNQYLRGR